MGATNKSDNVREERRCVTLGRIDVCRKIDTDTRKQEWDFLKGCWRDKPPCRGEWDLRFSN